MATQWQAAGEGAGTRPLWFSPPGGEENRRRVLTRDRVVAAALAIISASGAVALSMRALATASAWYPPRCTATSAARTSSATSSSTPSWPRSTARPNPALPWTGQVTVLAHRLRTVLERPPRHRRPAQNPRPISPHSLALAEAFPAPLRAAGLPACQAALAFRLIYDYTLGLALSDPTTSGEQRVQDTASRAELHAFLRSLPAASPR
jgi:hypothetical protein